ncbi:hypothetical protein LTR94_025613 [Friedmanniomyces endolithicus]|nr:hypothetical protein LTR94_025613 [Friedmanniomyces endolithicus]
MAAAAGLMLVPVSERDPGTATSHGVGELILAALDEGVERLIVGIGGSATNDGGAGMLQALGARLTDEEGRELAPGGLALLKLAKVDLSGLDPRLAKVAIDVACDVDNPLVGPEGASAIFGPQKGATPDMIQALDEALTNLARVLERDLGVSVADHPGAGAAGGLGAAFYGLLGGRLRPGVEIVTEAVGLAELVADADLVVTGEGRMDAQSIRGKTPMGVAKIAVAAGRPVIGIGGSLGFGAHALCGEGLEAIFGSIARPCSVEDALAQAHENLTSVARNVAATLNLGLGLAQSAPGAKSCADFGNAAA